MLLLDVHELSLVLSSKHALRSGRESVWIHQGAIKLHRCTSFLH